MEEVGGVFEGSRIVIMGVSEGQRGNKGHLEEYLSPRRCSVVVPGLFMTPNCSSIIKGEMDEFLNLLLR